MTDSLFNFDALTHQDVIVNAPSQPKRSDSKKFLPIEPTSIAATGLSIAEFEALILRFLFTFGSKKGTEIARQLKLPFRMVNEMLTSLKRQMFIGHKGAAQMGDYEYLLSDTGVDRARRLMEQCTYCGSAPVGLDEYVEAIKRQSIKGNHVDFESIKRAMEGIVIPEAAMAQIGQAVSAGRCMFLYGPPGNGKTTIASRVIDALGDSIWIPRSLSAAGEIIRLFDPNNHELIATQPNDSIVQNEKVDERWVQIKRPSIIVGGELRNDMLEVTRNPVTGVMESPIHLKSNGGCLIIDDFGRQQIETVTLLNRWIVPMERGADYVSFPNGRHVEIPFDQLLVFSTNLAPSELCDEAFLRRIPYKIEVKNPTHQQFFKLFKSVCKRNEFQFDAALVEHLIDRHFIASNRTLRYCHATDILDLVAEFCRFHRLPMQLTQESIDYAAHNYFAGLDT